MINTLRGVAVVEPSRLMDLRCPCVALQRASNGKNTQAHFPAVRHVQLSREVNAMSTDIPMESRSCYCIHVCPCKLPAKRPRNAYTALAVLRSIQTSTTAHGHGRKRQHSSGERPARAIPNHTRNNFCLNAGAPQTTTRCCGEDSPRVCKLTTATILQKSRIQ